MIAITKAEGYAVLTPATELISSDGTFYRIQQAKR